jgi:hypothetical protein
MRFKSISSNEISSDNGVGYCSEETCYKTPTYYEKIQLGNHIFLVPVCTNHYDELGEELLKDSIIEDKNG